MTEQQLIEKFRDECEYRTTHPIWNQDKKPDIFLYLRNPEIPLSLALIMRNPIGKWIMESFDHGKWDQQRGWYTGERFTHITLESGRQAIHTAFDLGFTEIGDAQLSTYFKDEWR